MVSRFSPTKTATITAAFLLTYALANALNTGPFACHSSGCRALQTPWLWWAGAAYGLALLITNSPRTAHLFSGLVLVGVVVECLLVFTQVALNLYCTACLGYTALFVVFVVQTLPRLDPVARKALYASVVLTVGMTVPLAGTTSAKTTCECPFTQAFGIVRAEDTTPQLVFEPTCPHCHETIEMLRQAGAHRHVRLCPQAWGLRSVWELTREHCRQQTSSWPHARCVLSVLATVRSNNAFCAERGLDSVPLVVHTGRIIQGADVPVYLAGLLQLGARSTNRGRASCSIRTTCN